MLPSSSASRPATTSAATSPLLMPPTPVTQEARARLLPAARPRPRAALLRIPRRLPQLHPRLPVTPLLRLPSTAQLLLLAVFLPSSALSCKATLLLEGVRAGPSWTGIRRGGGIRHGYISKATPHAMEQLYSVSALAAHCFDSYLHGVYLFTTAGDGRGEHSRRILNAML